MTKVGSLFQ